MCDCNFFCKILCTIVLVVAFLFNTLGNWIGVGDIIPTESCPFDWCYEETTEEETTEDTSQEGTTAASTTEVTEPSTDEDETTTTTKDAVTMSARLCQFCYSAMIRKEVHLNRLFNIEIPK